MKWKVCLIVTGSTCRHTLKAVESLHSAGFDEINLFAPRGVTLSDGETIIRHRCEAEASESDLFLHALHNFSQTKSAESDFVLVARSDLRIWEQSKDVLENTIEPDFMGVYFPVSPEPFFDDGHGVLPCSRGFGWCETKVREPVAGAPCIALNKHSAMLLSFAAGKSLADRRDQFPHWNYCLANLISDYDMPCFVHLPSMGKFKDTIQETIKEGARLKPGWETRNWYLN